MIAKERMNTAFRAAYNFLDAHNRELGSAVEMVSLADDLKGAVVQSGNDPLTMNLLVGVYDFICDQSKESLKNDARRIAEGS